MMQYSLATAAILGAVSVFASTTPCSANHNSTIEEPIPNTVDAFNTYELYSNTALAVQIPDGYEQVILDANGAVKDHLYMEYRELEFYSPDRCADICDNTQGCDAFNVYIQRNPSVVPGKDCPNPKANSLTRCGLYAQPISPGSATNTGQIREPYDANGVPFEIVIRGSNAYNKIVNGTSHITVTVTAPCTLAPAVTTTVWATVTDATTTTTLTETVRVFFGASSTPTKT